MDIAFNINPNGMEGLGATLSSLIRHCSNNAKLNLWFLCSDLEMKDKDNINQLLTQESFKGSKQFIDFDAKEHFGHLRSLHGDWTAYGRLLIPKLISSDRVLYLDTDLIVLADVLALQEIDFSEKVLAAVYGAPVEVTLDKDFFISRLKWSSKIGYFNSGVLLFNLIKWREGNYDALIKDLMDKYPDALISHDQTLLNAVAKGEFMHLSPNYNLTWYAGSKRPDNSEAAILHFVGSPKPWDFLGKWLHKGYAVWVQYHAPFWNAQYGRLTTHKLYRSWKIRRSILKHLKNRL